MGEDSGFSLFNLICIGVIFYGILVVVLLLMSKSSHRAANRMLATIIIIGVWYIITSLLILTKQFIHFPHLFRVGLPFYYAIPPLILLYVQSKTDKSFKFKYIHLLHLLPVLFATVDLMPFFLSDVEVKKHVIETMAKDYKMTISIRTGLLPDLFHIILRPTLGIIYMFIAGMWLYQSLQNKRLKKEIESQKTLKTWLVLFITFFGLIYLGVLAPSFIWMLPYSSVELLYISRAPFFLSIIAFLGIHIFLFLNIHIIFGKSQAKPKAVIDTYKSTIPVKETSSQLDIEKIILDEQLFKNPKITAPELAAKLGIAPHNFSTILNSQYGKRFPDFINMYRIKYVISELEKGTNENMSIEGIAMEAGFASRSAFYNSFKKTIGITPSEYLKDRVLK